MKKYLFFTGICCLFINHVMAGEERDYLGNIGVVVVTPTRYSTYISDLATNVDVITSNEMNENNVRTVGDALALIVGISDVSQRGTRGATRDIRIRGGGDSSKQVLVMIDNQPINDTGLGGADLEEIPVDFIDRIEVLRGPSSAIWGANALGGVVNIITKKPADETTVLTASIQEGDFNASKYNMQFQHNGKSLRTYISAANEDSEGWRENSEYNGNDFIIKAGKTIKNFGDIDAQIVYHQSEFGVPGKNTIAIDEYDGSLERIAQSPEAYINKSSKHGQFKLDNQLSETIALNTKFYGTVTDKTYANPEAFTDDLSETMSYGVEVQGNTSFGLVAGTDVSLNKFTRKDQAFTPAVTDIDEEIANLAVFVQQALRYKDAAFIMGLRYDAHSVYEAQFNPKGTLIYKLIDNMKISANVGRAFRAPTFEDMYSPETSWPASMFGPAGDTKGNTDLLPETAWGYDIGVEHELKSILLSRITFFRSDIENLIEWSEVDPDPAYDKWRPSNVGDAYNQGIEIELDSKITRNISQSINYTYLESKGKGENDTEYRPLQYTPKNRINYRLTYTAVSNIKLNAAINYTEEVQWEDNFGIEHKLDGYTIINTNISKKINIFEFIVGVNNVFDSKYQTRENYPLPGRVFKAGLKLSLLM
ncbi:TonB-dependent receptor plug domain-containing protein [Elusimicrobiota bacterium]